MDSSTPTAVGAPPPTGTRPDRRVRHEVRDSLAVMAFSAVSSLAVAAVLTVLVRFGS
ncbi:MAG: hypothetical protein JWR42_2114 [Marmoricola sp.]|nr:hypothetical protein [Marmoricola sp.]